MSHSIRICLVFIAYFATAMVRAENITVFAASSLKDVMTRIAQSYAGATGDNLLLSFAASSTLARQIAAGAPADLYISANQKWMDWLAERKMIARTSRQNLLGNALVLIAPSDSPLAPFKIGAQSDLRDLLGDRDYIAVGDPDHVPAGIYAKQALASLGQWQAIKARLARADNVRAALALVEHGEAALGIVYQTDAAIDKEVKVLAKFPQGSDVPITYPIAIVAARETPASVALLNWLLRDEAEAIFREYGFTRPTER